MSQSGLVSCATRVVIALCALLALSAAPALASPVIQTVAGNGLGSGYSGDGAPATQAMINTPQGVAVAPDGGFYIADAANQRIRYVAPDGTISTFAGAGGSESLYRDDVLGSSPAPDAYFPLDGALSDVISAGPSLANDGASFTSASPALWAGTSYASFSGSGQYLQLSSNPLASASSFTISLWLHWNGGAAGQRIFDFRSGTGEEMFLTPSDANGRVEFGLISGGTEQELEGPSPYSSGGSWLGTGSWYHIAVTMSGSDATLYVDGWAAASSSSFTAPDLAAMSTVTLGGSPSGGDFQGAEAEASFYESALSESALSAQFSAGAMNRCPYPTDPCGDGGPAAQAHFGDPDGVALAPNGDLYIADNHDYRVRMVPAQNETLYGIAMRAGDIYTVAGDGVDGNSGDGGPATRASIGQSETDAVSADGTLYIADLDNNVVRKVAPDGTISTLATRITNALGIAVDGSGNVYVAAMAAQEVDKIAPDGTVSTIAGCVVSPCDANPLDSGPATSAALNDPHGLALGPDGSVYFSDRGNHVIRAVSPAGTITTVAGDGTAGFSGDGGPATAAQLNYNEALAVGADGNLYLADTLNNRIREVFVDIGPPSVAITSATPNQTATSALISYIEQGDVTNTSCTLDSAPVPCTSAQAELSSLSAGQHTFTVSAGADGASASAAVSWSVSGPGINITSQPSDSVSTSALVAYSESGTVAATACALDGAPVPCTNSQASLSELSAGQHTFTVTASGAGQSATATAYWTVFALPAVAFTHTPSDSTATSAVISYTESGTVAITTCKLDSASVPCTSAQASLQGLGAGQHTFTVSDSAPDGTSSKTITAIWTVLAPPAVAFTHTPSDSTATSALISYTESGDVSATSCALDDAPVPCTNSQASLSGLSAGQHTLTVTANAPDGTNSPTVTATWTVLAPSGPTSPPGPSHPSSGGSSSSSPGGTPSTSAPSAKALARPLAAHGKKSVSYRLDASQSQAPGARILTYVWYVGSRVVARGARVQVTLKAGQRVRYRLVITTSAHATAQATLTLAAS